MGKDGRRRTRRAGDRSSDAADVLGHRVDATARCTPRRRQAAPTSEPLRCCCSTSSVGCRPTSRRRATACSDESFVDAAAPGEYRTIDTAAADLEAECAAIDAWIDAGPDGRLDLAVLGLGVNGHIGMNEPGSPADGRTARLDLAPTTIAGARRYFAGRVEPTWGVTVGLGDLLAAREVWVLATGAGKAEIVGAATLGQVHDRRPGLAAAAAPERDVVAGPGGGNQLGDVRLPACGSCRSGATGYVEPRSVLAGTRVDRPLQQWWPWLASRGERAAPRRSLAVRRPASPAVHGAVHHRVDRGRPADDRRRNDHGRHHRRRSHRNRSRR